MYTHVRAHGAVLAEICRSGKQLWMTGTLMHAPHNSVVVSRVLRSDSVNPQTVIRDGGRGLPSPPIPLVVCS